MSRHDTIRALAPVAPPCFATRDIWISYLRSAAEAQRDEHKPGPLLPSYGQVPRFNYDFRFCADCTQQHSLAMDRAGLCQPGYLRALDPARRVIPIAPAASATNRPTSAAAEPEAA